MSSGLEMFDCWRCCCWEGVVGALRSWRSLFADEGRILDTSAALEGRGFGVCESELFDKAKVSPAGAGGCGGGLDQAIC